MEFQSLHCLSGCEIPLIAFEIVGKLFCEIVLTQRGS